MGNGGRCRRGGYCHEAQSEPAGRRRVPLRGGAAAVQGFHVWPSGWNSEANARGLAGCALRNNGERMSGYLATTWIGTDATVRALAGDTSGNKNAAGVAAAIKVGLRLAWEGQ